MGQLHVGVLGCRGTPMWGLQEHMGTDWDQFKHGVCRETASHRSQSSAFLPPVDGPAPSPWGWGSLRNPTLGVPHGRSFSWGGGSPTLPEPKIHKIKGGLVFFSQTLNKPASSTAASVVLGAELLLIRADPAEHGHARRGLTR